jgi:RNA-directed DNA polymerase
LIGAFFLNALDTAAAKLRLFYIRFMDDILILAPTRWQLRGAVKVVNQTLGALSLEKHPTRPSSAGSSAASTSLVTISVRQG